MLINITNRKWLLVSLAHLAWCACGVWMLIHGWRSYDWRWSILGAVLVLESSLASRTTVIARKLGVD